jgi:hypothetical protein
LTGTCPAVTFTVQGTKVTTSSTTVFTGVTCAALVNGTNVQVSGQKQADGTIAASKVVLSTTPPVQSQAEVEGAVSALTGTCPALAFTVQGTKVTTTATTTFERVTCATVQNATVVDVKGTRQTDGSIVGTKVETGAAAQPPAQNQAEAKGAVSALTGTCPAITFTVQGAKVTTTSTTTFSNVTCAAVANGKIVEVTGTRQTDGSITATRIQADDNADNGDDNEDDKPNQNNGELKGAVAALTGTCPALAFTIQGTKVTTTTATSFDKVTCASVKNGSVLQIKGTRQTDGSIAATRVKIDD